MRFNTGALLAWFLMTFVLSGGLMGCSVASLVGAQSGPPPATHDLVASPRRGLGHLRVQLVVREPRTVDALSNSHIAIMPKPNEISYFSGAVWTDKLPRLIQLRLVETFEDSRILKAVSSGDDRIRGDFGLSLEIRDFQVEIEGGAAKAHVRIYAKIVDEDAGELVSAKEFSAVARAADDKVVSGVAALQEAFAASTVKMMRWITTRRIVLAEARR